jgi:NitT/TauT family transport system ATP-binding protein
MVAELSAVAFAYPTQRVPVLQDLNLSLRAGRTMSMLGPNGSGKSTVVKLIAGLMRPSRGDVRSPAHAGQPTPIVFQDYRAALFPWLTVEDNLALPLVLTGHTWAHARESAAALAKEAALPFGLHRRPQTLSGGQAQLLSVLRALIVRSPLVIFDEPFSALDLFTSFDLAATASSLLRTRSTACLFVSHSIDEAIVMGDEIVILGGAPARVRAHIELPERAAAAKFDRTSADFINLRNQVVEAVNASREHV